MRRRKFMGTGAAALLGAGSVRAAGSRVPDYAETGAQIVTGKPAEQGFAFPAEWEPHERTLMQFPTRQNWYRLMLDGARAEWAAVANRVAEHEPVTMAVQKQDRAAAQKVLSPEIALIEMPLNDAWSRDSGPMIVKNSAGERRVAGFVFNGWGGKFPPFQHDALAKARFAAHLDMAMYTSKMVLEGGAVAVDGQGTLITTEECLLHPTRNKRWSAAQIEAELRGYLGVEKVIWLPNGLTPDPVTDGHVDGLAAFAAPGIVLMHTTQDRSDPNYDITQAAKRILQDATDARGRRLQVIEVPMTSWEVSYMNFYICNDAVIVPTTGVKSEDDTPLGILREAFPRRKVIPVQGTIMGGGGGGVHCITQQVPAV